MADGYEVIVKLNAPPVAQYASGNSVIIQGHSVEEVLGLVGDALAKDDTPAATVLRYLVELGLEQATGHALKPEKPAAKPAAKKPAAAKAAPVEQNPDGPATDALIGVAAKKSGKTVDELKGISTAEAKALISAAK